MQRNRRLTLSALAAIAALLATVGPVTARSTRTPIDMWEVSCLVEPGVEWVADGVLHVRGRQTQATFYEAGGFTIVGSDGIVSNANLDVTTQSGTLFGTWSAIYLPASTTGTFDGTWRARLTNGVIAVGTAVAHGTGELRGQKMKLGLRVDPADPPPPGLLFVLGTNPPCDPSLIVGILHDTGFIHDPHGN